MKIKRLTLILLAAIAVLLPTQSRAAKTATRHTMESINPFNNRPQWQDIGLYDVLAFIGNSTVTAPTTVREVHESPAGTTSGAIATLERHYKTLQTDTYGGYHTVSGYIYLICCLRL